MAEAYRQLGFHLSMTTKTIKFGKEPDGDDFAMLLLSFI
jgi:hypothetical protein